MGRQGLHHRHRMALALAGALLVPAFAPWQFIWLVFPSFAVLFTLLQRFDVHGFQIGYWFGLGLFAAGLPWLYTSLHDFGGLIAPVAILLTLLFSAFMALFPALACWLHARIQPTAWLAIPTLAASWTLTEWLRSWFLTGFPWLSMGYVLSDTPLKWLFAAGGTPLATLAIILLALIPASCWPLNRARYSLPALVLLLALLMLMPWQPHTHPQSSPLSVALLQGNYAQDIKWDPQWIPREMDWYRTQTLKQQAELILWPETAIPATTHSAGEWLADLDKTLKQRQQGALVGIIDQQGDRFYNALLGLGSLQGRYHKRHLVLLGEYFPFRSWLQLLPGLFIPANDFSHGALEQAPLLLHDHLLLANICYEDVFGNEMRNHLLQHPEAGLLINASNDAWFGRTAPGQHLQMARMRAVELGRPLLRVTNTGITAIIQPDGQLQAQLPAFQAGVLQADVTPYSGQTRFIQWGAYWVVWLCMVLLLIARLTQHQRNH